MITELTTPATILVVDDVPENLRLLSRELQQHGYEVRGVLTGRMALTVARSAPIDLILLDVRLPDMDGYAVCQTLKADQATAALPIIFISALDEPLDKVRAFSVGAVDYITKPFKTIELIARISTQLRLVEARLQLEHFNQSLEAQIHQRTTELRQANASLQTEIQVRQQAEAALRASEGRYKLIANHMSDLVCLHQADGTLQYVSPSCQALLGYDPDDMCGQNLLAFCHPDDREQLQPCFGPSALAPTGLHGVIKSCYRIRCHTGSYLWFETFARSFLDEGANLYGVVTSSRDVTPRISMEEQLRYEALHDSLTGLPNRNWLTHQIELELERCQQVPGYQFGVLMLDLDQFKSVNDTLGHLIGDQLLIAVAQRLQNCVQATDVVTRIGGDEFVILLNDTPGLPAGIQLADCIRVCLKTPFDIQGRVIRTSASVGILMNDGTYTSSDRMLRDVDIALYRAKAEGRDRYAIFDIEMFQLTLHRVTLENDLHAAIAQQHFVTYYQPIYALPTQTLVGFEALVRWQNPAQGLIMPGEFIDLAEETGLIMAITQQVIQHVCQALKHWQDEQLLDDNFRVAINISGQSFRDPNFLPTIDQHLQQAPRSPQYLTLEITERILLEQSGSILDTLVSIKERGIRLSIDDFGTGYSSLKYLSRFPIDTLKIDKSFVNDIHTSGQGIVRAIIDLAHNLDMQTVAEGVEHPAQVQRLIEMGCEAAQGYLFARPLAIADATQLLRSAARDHA